MSQLSSHFLNDLKNRAVLSDLVKPAIGDWDKKKSSPARRDWWAPCPFHTENTSSFHVDDRKGYYHCFSCGAHGSAIDWLINHQRMHFIEAVKHLCDITGTPMPEMQKNPEQYAR